MESQPDTQLVEQIEPTIAALAATGRLRWEPVKIDIDLLMDVPLVRTRLGGLEVGDRADPDTKLTAISDALEAAIQTLPNPYRQAALDHFGFTEKDPRKPSNQGSREHRAAKAWGYGGGWYRRPREEYFGMKTSEYVITLATCAFCGIADPIAYIAKRKDANAEVTPKGSQADQATSGDVETFAVEGFLGELASLGATMVSRDRDHLEVFWIGANNEVFCRWWSAGQGWSRAETWAEPAAVALTAVSRGPGDEMLFGLSPDGQMWCRVWEIGDEGWPTAGGVQWIDDDEIVYGPLASASRGEGMVELFAFDANGRPWHCWIEDGLIFSPWTYW